VRIMKKIVILVLLMFVFSIIVLAENEVKQIKTEEAGNAVAITAVKEQTRAEITEQLKERENLKEVSQEGLDKIAQLKEQNREKIQELKQEQVERLTAVKEERLAKIARNLNQKNIEKISSLDQELIEKLASLDRTRLKEYAELSDEELKAKLEKINVKKVSVEKAFKERTVAKEKVELAKQNLNQAKEEYKQAKEQLKEQKKLLLGAEDDAKKFEYLREYLTSAANTIINRLNIVKEKINENENIDEVAASEMVADIDSRIKELEENKEKISTLTALDELKEHGKVIAEQWREIKLKNSIKETEMLRANVQEVFKRSEHLEARLEKVLADMEEKGIPTEIIDAKVDSFSSKIDEARNLFKQSQEKFNEAKNLVNVTMKIAEMNQVKEAQELAQQANKKLKEAHAILVDLMENVKNAGLAKDVEEPETGEVEIVEEVSENE